MWSTWAAPCVSGSTPANRPETLAHRLYDDEVVYERHRHRYEFNNAYRNLFLESGYVVSGVTGRTPGGTDRTQGHPFFTACQYHPNSFHGQGVPTHCSGPD